MKRTEKVDREFARLLPRLRRIEEEVLTSDLDHKAQTALITMMAARLMGTAGARMAAAADADAGRPPDNSTENIAAWTGEVAQYVVGLIRSRATN